MDNVKEAEEIADLELDFSRWFEKRFKGIQYPIQKHQATLLAKASYVEGMQRGVKLQVKEADGSSSNE